MVSVLKAQPKTSVGPASQPSKHAGAQDLQYLKQRLDVLKEDGAGAGGWLCGGEADGFQEHGDGKDKDVC